MKIEAIATPQQQPSPQVRYASLNRAIEGGLATDHTWSELTRVCLELGRDDEACAAFRRVRDVPTRRRLLVYLHRRGLMLGMDPASLGAVGPKSPSAPQQQTEEDTVTDMISDSVRYLFVDHMPLAVIVTTVIFPIVVGLGGALSAAAGSTMFLPLIALIPALSIVGLVGAMGRRILLESARGLDDPPEIPSAQDLVHESLRFIVDGGLLGLVFLGPGFLMGLLGVGVAPAISALIVGGMLLPMAMALRQSRNDWQCLNPNVLFRAVVDGGSRYLGCAAFSIAVFAPALLSIWITRGSHVYLVISVIGPLAVAPLFMTSRLMGQILFFAERDRRRRDIAGTPTNRATTTKSSRAPAAPTATRTPLRGATPHPEAGPTKRRSPWSKPAQKAPAAAPMQAAAAPAASSTPPGQGFFGNSTPEEVLNFPGARVLRGKARVAAGASAPIRPR